jgi:nicotinamidase-related amidase
MEHIRGLRFGLIASNAVHLCIDMQRLFAHDSPWASGAVQAALPAASEVCRWKPQAVVFTQFLCPDDPDSARGQWAVFYRGCPAITKLDPRLFDIVPELKSVAVQAQVVSRSMFSAFQGSELQTVLRHRRADTLVFSGVETDVCVLATALSAIDLGYRVIVVEEAVASSNVAGHAAAMAGIFPRFDQQVEVVGVSELLSCWA